MKTMLLCLLVLAGSAQSQVPADTSSPYVRAGALYAQVVAESLQAENCSGRRSAVVKLQKQLATALEQVEPADGQKVMLYAVTANSLPQVKRFNAAGALKNGDNGTLLHVAAQYADPTMLDFLLSLGFGIEAHGGTTASALFSAVTSGRQDNTTWFIQHKADVNAVDTQGNSVLRHSLMCNDSTMLNLLMRAGAKADDKTLELAAKRGVGL